MSANIATRLAAAIDVTALKRANDAIAEAMIQKNADP
jgi:hypothetical protein